MPTPTPLNSAGAPAPPRILGLFDATCVVIGAIVGVGIFFTPHTMAGLTHSGPLLLLAWVIGGLIALAGALTFAELGGMYSASGAQYEILRDAYGPFPAFLFVFCNATAVQPGAIAIISIICATNMLVAAGQAAAPGIVLGLALVLIVAITLANVLGVRWGSRIQNVTVVTKLAALVAIGAIAALWGRADVAASTTIPGDFSGTRAVMAALVPALFAYGGWQQALWISGEVNNPGRNLPRAIVGGVVVVIAVYLLANWAYLRLLGIGGVMSSSALAADAVAVPFPGPGRRAIAAAVAVSALGVLNAQLLSGPRLVYGMARDGRFFAAFARLSPRFATPVAAILLLSVVALVILVAIRDPDRIDRHVLTSVMFIDLFFFALTGAAVIVLRRKRPTATRTVRVPGFPFVPVLFVLGECAALIGAYVHPEPRRAATVGAAWIIVAALVYWSRFSRRAGPTPSSGSAMTATAE